MSTREEHQCCEEQSCNDDPRGTLIHGVDNGLVSVIHSTVLSGPCIFDTIPKSRVCRDTANMLMGFWF